ncbi:Kiwa anti-phage protein KwaB-like domain-containing protein [Cronobacter dublinensis]
MALFALMDNSATPRIFRVELDKDASALVTQIFQDQRKHFETHHFNKIAFYAGYEPKYDECFQLNNFSDSNPLIDAVKRPTAIPVWDPKKTDIERVKAFFVGVESPAHPEIIALQTFNKKQILDTSKSFLGYIVGKKTTFTKTSSIGFNVDDKLVAVIYQNEIYFKSFFKLRSVFDMNKYFCAATDKQLDSFALLPIFSSMPGFSLKNEADTVIRNKVTLINQTGLLKPENLSLFKNEAIKVGFPLQITTQGGTERIVLPSTKKEIKALLDFIEEDIWISGISGRKFKAGSKRPL